MEAIKWHINWKKNWFNSLIRHKKKIITEKYSLSNNFVFQTKKKLYKPCGAVLRDLYIKTYLHIWLHDDNFKLDDQLI